MILSTSCCVNVRSDGACIPAVCSPAVGASGVVVFSSGELVVLVSSFILSPFLPPVGVKQKSATTGAVSRCGALGATQYVVDLF